MARATSQALSSAREPAPTSMRQSASQKHKASAGNPIFKTEQFGQHILKNPLVSQAIVDKAGLKPSDQVLEIGPGTGNLTVRILEQCKRCYAVEMDPRMAAELAKRVQGTPLQRKLEIMVGDFVKAELPQFDVCISNTPYNISSRIVFRLLSQRPLVRCAVLMFQREFAYRLAAKPGDAFWNRLSANVQLYAKVDIIMKVSRNSFRPPPEVESSVVRLSPLDPPPPVAFEEFDGMNRVLFSRGNRMVRAAFSNKGVLGMLESNYKVLCAVESRPVPPDFKIGELVNAAVNASGFGETRPSKMSVNELLLLLTCFHNVGLHFA